MVGKLPLELEQDFISDYKSGMSYKDLGKKYGFGSTAARSYIIELGVERRVSYGKHNKYLIYEQEIEIKRLYTEERLSYKSIQERLGLKSMQPIQTFLENNLKMRRSPGPLSKYDWNVEEQICQKYIGGLSSTILSTEYELSNSAILGIMDRHGYDYRHEKAYIYNLNDHFFDVINNEQTAYFLGIFHADGSVSSNPQCPEMILGLQECDKPILEKLNNLVTTDRPLRFAKKQKDHHENQYKIVMYSYHMRDILISYGVVPCKSLIKTFPEVISSNTEDVIRHFIRGYFDGNGSIGFNKRNDREDDTCGYRAVITFVSTREMCESIQELSKKYLDINFRLYKASSKNDSNTYIVTISGFRNVKTFMSWLYKDATLLMDRKYEIYKEICEYKSQYNQ